MDILFFVRNVSLLFFKGFSPDLYIAAIATLYVVSAPPVCLKLQLGMAILYVYRYHLSSRYCIYLRTCMPDIHMHAKPNAHAYVCCQNGKGWNVFSICRTVMHIRYMRMPCRAGDGGSPPARGCHTRQPDRR